ncbi:MAG: hypothetical protein AB1499_02325 [Nitrospirota bacterium]
MKKILVQFGVLLIISICAMFAWANVPAPPVNQEMGFQDGIFDNLVEADCRACHENPDQFPVEDVYIPDRHHLLVGTPIGDPNSAPFGDPPDNFVCLSCHRLIWDPVTMTSTFDTFRDCLYCHHQVPNDASVHHLTQPARDADCKHCHGSVVNNIGDGHIISTYQPSMVTPKPSGGTGLPLNSEGNGAGACTYCHSTGTGTTSPGTDIGTGILVYRNFTTHHTTVISTDLDKCSRCHDMQIPKEYYIRVCEGCHGYQSLHNIQVDSDGDGTITPGMEMPFYGHIGNNDDCWGCHGFSASSAPGTGPLAPHIIGTDITVVTQGTATPVNVYGTVFTNVAGGYQVVSQVLLTAYDGSTTLLVPDNVTQDTMTVTIPGNLAIGNYDLRAIKGETKSNPTTISVIPSVVITNVDCNRKKGLLTVTGSGFGEKFEGTDEYLRVLVNRETADIISWTPNQIKMSVAECSNNITVTVDALFGSASSGNGKPPKPCKGKGCNK